MTALRAIGRLLICAALAIGALAAPIAVAAPAKPAPAKSAPAKSNSPKSNVGVVSMLTPSVDTTSTAYDVIEAPVKSFVEMRFVGIERQTLDLSCGAAALATLLHSYFGLQADEASVIRGILAGASPDDAKKIAASGFSMLELKRFAESEGLVAGGFKTKSSADLRKLRAPVIALVNSRGYNHFIVVRSVRGDQVAIADPVFGNRTETLAQFAKRWNGVILVAVAPGRKTNAAFMDPPRGYYDPRAEQLYLTRSYAPAISFGPGDFF
ncbi:MAG: C39 family peptidase [Caulobacterales bacterium]